MGTPLNILFWILAVGFWIGMGPLIAKSSFLPAWFTSNAFNFPLNTVTTLAELYIGFLVGAAANRNERANKKQSEHNSALTEKIEHMMEEQDNVLKLLQTNSVEELKELKQSMEILIEEREILIKENEILKNQISVKTII